MVLAKNSPQPGQVCHLLHVAHVCGHVVQAAAFGAARTKPLALGKASQHGRDLGRLALQAREQLPAVIEELVKDREEGISQVKSLTAKSAKSAKERRKDSGWL